MTNEMPGISTELALEESDAGAQGWHRYVALTTVVAAAFAAVAALFAGISAHEELVDRSNEIVSIAEGSADRALAFQLQTKHELLAGLGLAIDPDEVRALAEYKAEANAFLMLGAEAESAASAAGSTHLILAIAATVLGISIVVTGLSVIVARRWVWAAGGVLALAGVGLLTIGLVSYAG